MVKQKLRINPILELEISVQFMWCNLVYNHITYVWVHVFMFMCVQFLGKVPERTGPVAITFSEGVITVLGSIWNFLKYS